MEARPFGDGQFLNQRNSQMKKVIAICFAFACALLTITVALLGLCLMGSLCATVWGTVAVLLTAPSVFDVIESAFQR